MAVDTRVSTPDSTIAGIAETLRFLGDPTRLRIIAMMARSEVCVCDFTDRLGLSQPLVSYHLAKLRGAGMVRHRREGTWVYYSLDPDVWSTTLAPVRAMLDLSEELPPAAAPDGRADCDPPSETDR